MEKTLPFKRKDHEPGQPRKHGYLTVGAMDSGYAGIRVKLPRGGTTGYWPAGRRRGGVFQNRAGVIKNPKGLQGPLRVGNNSGR